MKRENPGFLRTTTIRQQTTLIWGYLNCYHASLIKVWVYGGHIINEAVGQISLMMGAKDLQTYLGVISPVFKCIIGKPSHQLSDIGEQVSFFKDGLKISP